MAQPTVGSGTGTSPWSTISEDSGNDLRREAAGTVQGPHFDLPRHDEIRLDFDGTYDEFAGCLRAELAPSGVLEDLLASRLVAAAWRLHRHLVALRDGVLRDESGIAGLEESLGRAVATFERARSARRASWGHAVPSETVNPSARIAAPDLPDEDPTDFAEDLGWSRRFEADGQDEGEDDRPDQPEGSSDPGRLWRDRLVLDPDIADLSPVVKGTWITVGHVVTLVVDGWSWADILRAHPELSEDDIRACLTYSVEEEGSGSLEG